jgi:hypothetical protein
MTISVRPSRQEDEEAIVQLLQQSFPDWATRPNPNAYFRWKYHRDVGKSRFIIAEDNEKIVGCHGYVSCKAKIGDKTHEAYYGDDAATHPYYKGRGVYSKIVNNRDETIGNDENQFIYYMTTNPITIENNKKRGRPQFPHRISHMIRIRNTHLHFEKTIKQHRSLIELGFNILKRLNSIRYAFQTSQKTADIQITQADLNQLSLEQLWKEIEQLYTFIIIKDEKFLRWRYGDKDGGEYTAHIASQGDQILGLAITEQKTGDYPQAYITDFLVNPSRSDVAKQLLQTVCTHYDNLGVNSLNCRAVKGSTLERLTASCGFIYASYISNLHLFYDQQLNPQAKETLAKTSPEKLYFSYGDLY